MRSSLFCLCIEWAKGQVGVAVMGGRNFCYPAVRFGRDNDFAGKRRVKYLYVCGLVFYVARHDPTMTDVLTELMGRFTRETTESLAG